MKYRVKSQRVSQMKSQRSPRACSACRCRKVRCDVSSKGAPCTTCRFHDIPCSVPVDRRGEKPSSVTHLPDNPSPPQSEGVRTRHVTTFEDRNPEYWSEKAASFQEGKSDSLFSRNAPIRWEKWLPDFATPLPPSVTKQDCRFLKKEGAFDVPDARVKDELIRKYIQFVHPLMPILDLEDFLVVIDKSYTGSQGVSFLLFQAIMFAATQYETTESITREGFRNRREARKTRYERVKLLYSYGCEDDPIAILQTILLMTFWDESCDDFRDAWHWVGVANALTKSIELRANQTETREETCSARLWRRIRWSCYMRDRLVGITKRRPMHMEDSELDIPMLTMSDFEMGPLSTKCCLGTDGSHPAIRDPPTRRVLAQASIALAQLCQCISRVLESQYVVAEKKNIGCSMPYLVLKHPAASPGEVLLRDSDLEEWRSSLPETLRWRAPESTKCLHRHGDVKSYFCAMLSGIYNIASSALHRPQTVSTSSLRAIHSSTLPELRLLSEQRVRDSAISTATIHEYLREQGQVGILPDGQVAMLESAILAHLSDLQSTSTTNRQSALHGSQLCAKALKQLTETYASAEESLGLVQVAVQMSDLSRGERLNPMSDPLFDAQEIHSQEIVECNSTIRHDGNLASESVLWQHIHTLEPPQVGKLLFSHFMMTPWERNLLAELALSEKDGAHPDEIIPDSVSEQASQHKPRPPPEDQSMCPIDAILEHLDDDSLLDKDHSREHRAHQAPSGSSRPTRLTLIQDPKQLDDVEWDVFTMLSQYGTE